MQSTERQALASSLSFELNKWQRLSLFAVLYYFFQSVFNVARSAIYLIPVIALNFAEVKAHLPIVIPIVMGLLCVIICWSIATYLKFTFQLTDEKLVIRSGVFKRQALDLPYYRVQSVKIVQPFFFRFSGHAAATFDSAGSAQQEAVLAALNIADAQIIKNHVMHVANQRIPQTEDSVDEQQLNIANDGIVLNTRSLKDLVIHGISNNRVWLILGVIAPFFESIFDHAVLWLTAQGWMLNQLVSEQTIAWWQFGLYAVTILVIVGSLVALLSVLGAILVFYNYTLVKQGDRYVRKSGLLSVQEISMQHRRLQVVKLKQDWLDVILQRINFYYMQNKTGVVAGNPQAQTNQVLVPSVNYAEANALLTEAMPDSQADSIKFHTISRHYLINRYLVKLLPLFVLMMFISLFADTLSPVLITCAVFLLLAGLVYLRWQRWGIAWDEHYVYVRSGLIGKTVQCFERFKLQQISLKQSVFMQRNRVANIEFVLASGPLTVPFLHQSLATELAQSTLDTAQQTHRSWM